MVGAVVGAAIGYLFLSDQGRRLRRQIEPALDNFGRELGQFRTTLAKASGLASEGWAMLNEAAGSQPQLRHQSPHQTNPF
jgi:gas vesicle protein